MKEGAVVAVKGKCVCDKGKNGGTESEPEIKLIASEIRALPHVKQSIVMAVPHMGVWTDDIYPQIYSYYEKDGYNLHVYDKAFSSLRKTTLTVSEDVLYLQFPNVEITSKIIS